MLQTVKMPRNYVRKTDNASYPLEKLLEAVRAVKNGSLSGYEASKHYGIPRSTIINRVSSYMYLQFKQLIQVYLVKCDWFDWLRLNF